MHVIQDLIRNPCAMTRAAGVCQQAGGCPAASNFLLRRQKKVTKEKATLLSATPFAGATGATYGARSSRGGERERNLERAPTGRALRVLSPRIGIGSRSPQPVGLGRGAQAKADQGRHLFEAQPSLCMTPLLASTAGCLKRSGRTQTIGSPFFWVLFFGEAKKSASPAGASPGLSANHRVSAKPVVSDRNGLKASSLASRLLQLANRECRPSASCSRSSVRQPLLWPRRKTKSPLQAPSC